MTTRLIGRYELIREIGSGGMGRVFQAVDIETGQSVAAKILQARGELQPDTLLRFYQEGAVLATLKHPNIVEVYGTFLERDTCSIIMELLEGHSLSQLLRTERLTLDRTKRIVLQIASALAHAHDRSIIHRDVKPGNTMLVGDDHVKVMDFGIARVALEGATLNTATGTSLGTPLYMAPEQIEGQDVDGRADMYSLGAMLYQMVTGRPPFEGRDPLSIAFKHVHVLPRPPSEIDADVPRDWEAIILMALAKDPADRFPDMASFATAVEQAVGGTVGGTTALPASPLPGGGEQFGTPELTDVATAASSVSGEPSQVEGAHLDVSHGVKVEQSSTIGRPVKRPAILRRSKYRPFALAGPQVRGVWWMVVAGGMAVVLLALVFGVLRFSSRSEPTRVASSGVASRGKPALVWGGRVGSGKGQFSRPNSLTLDLHGNLYVADTGNNRIQKLSPRGTVLATWGRKGTASLHFDHPHAVALDRHGNIYVADTGNYRVQKLSSQGRLLSQWRGSGAAQFAAPYGIAVDASDNVYVSDADNDTIYKVSPRGSLIATWRRSGSRPGEFLGPAGLALDPLGNLYVADSDNNRIQKLSPEGKSLAVWGTTGIRPGQFDAPTFVALDVWGNVYVADTGNNRVQKLSPSGKPLAVWGREGSKAGSFRSPGGVAVDAQGNTYIADTGNNRIQMFSSAGHMLFQWGWAGTHLGQFHTPAGIAIDHQGDVYVADAQNYRVQKFSATGRLLGHWGTHGPGLGHFVLPIALAVDAENNVYVLDTRQATIQKFSSTGKPLARWGEPGSDPGQFASPLDIAVDSRKNIYVADSSNARIQKLSPTGKAVAQWRLDGPAMGIPTGLAVDSHDNVYVIESMQSAGTFRSRIRKLSPTGKELAVWGGTDAPESRFGYLYGVAVDAQRNVYVADPGHPFDLDPGSYTGRVRIHKLSPSGRTLVVWGTSGSGFGQLRFPTGIAVDSYGDMYIADAGNNRVVKLSPSG